MCTLVLRELFLPIKGNCCTADCSNKYTKRENIRNKKLNFRENQLFLKVHALQPKYGFTVPSDILKNIKNFFSGMDFFTVAVHEIGKEYLKLLTNFTEK
jgi:hypothetical protein